MSRSTAAIGISFGSASCKLCFDCHDRQKRRLELHGYSNDIDDDGWPIDPRHPANKVR